MDYKRRVEIFAKEAMHIKDVMELYGVKYGSAVNIILDMKRKREFQGRPLRLKREGYIHVLDYLEEIGVDIKDVIDRYYTRRSESLAADFAIEYETKKYPKR